VAGKLPGSVGILSPAPQLKQTGGGERSSRLELDSRREGQLRTAYVPEKIRKIIAQKKGYKSRRAK